MNQLGEKENPNNGGKYKVLMCLLPYWVTMTPPQSIGQLKRFIQENSVHTLKAVDFNVMNEFKDLYNMYFETLKGFLPEDKRGGFYNVGQDVLQNHMSAHANHTDEKEYMELVKLIVYQNYFYSLTDDQADMLNKILDEIYSEIEKKLAFLIETEKPNIVGLDMYNLSFAATIFAARFIRKNYPYIKILVGGAIFMWQMPMGTPDFEYFTEITKGCVDKIFVGAGQHLILKYLNGGLPEEKRIYTTEDLGEGVDYSQHILPELSDFNVEYYPYLPATGSTSCPFKCGFCIANAYYGEYRKRDVKQVVSEIAGLKEKYNRQLFFMSDSLLNPIISDITRELISSGVSIYFDGFFRVDKESADIENTLLWRRGGFYKARLGVESGSQHILDLMDKRITTAQVKATISALAYAGIKTTTLWIVGHPGETEEDFQMTLDMLEELKDDIYEVECNPFFYYHTTQTSTSRWEHEARLLYPESARDMLLAQTWILDCEPSREEVFRRLNRFGKRCSDLGIPYLFSMNEIYEADKRWKKLHSNAAPSLVEIENNNCLDEKENVKKLSTAKVSQLDNSDFDFGF